MYNLIYMEIGDERDFYYHFIIFSENFMRLFTLHAFSIILSGRLNALQMVYTGTFKFDDISLKFYRPSQEPLGYYLACLYSFESIFQAKSIKIEH